MDNMRQLLLAILIFATSLTYASCSIFDVIADASAQDRVKANLGEKIIIYVTSLGIGDIAVQISLPEKARYDEGAGVIVDISTFFTASAGFKLSLDVNAVGLIHVSYLWPGETDRSGAKSDGSYDHGGEDSIRALRDVILFASGQIPDRNGDFIKDLLEMDVLTENIGLYAFSHPGIAAVNVLALYPEELAQVGFFVGRENPTIDKLSSVEVGYYESGNRVQNPLYQYPTTYSHTDLLIDYSGTLFNFDVDRPYFDMNGNGIYDSSIDHLLGPRVPTMFGKDFYSIDLTNALRDNQAFEGMAWPDEIASPEEAADLWPFRSSVHRYSALKDALSHLRVMLVFARDDHVQPAPDKPHIHQAYHGFSSTAGLWTRLNPDRVYVDFLNPRIGRDYREHPANSEPGDWLEADSWGHTNEFGAAQFVPLAAVAEMADRLHQNNWSRNLDRVLVEFELLSGQ